MRALHFFTRDNDGGEKEKTECGKKGDGWMKEGLKRYGGRGGAGRAQLVSSPRSLGSCVSTSRSRLTMSWRC